MARLVLDTGVIIAGVRGHLDVAELGDSDDVVIPAVAVAEYLAGTLLDPDPVARLPNGPSSTKSCKFYPSTPTTQTSLNITPRSWLMGNARAARGAPTTSSSPLLPVPPTGSS